MTAKTRETIAKDCQVSNRSCIHVISDGGADCYPNAYLIRVMQGGDLLVLDHDRVRVASYTPGMWTIDVLTSG